jgi:hypothetical protein
MPLERVLLLHGLGRMGGLGANIHALEKVQGQLADRDSDPTPGGGQSIHDGIVASAGFLDDFAADYNYALEILGAAGAVASGGALGVLAAAGLAFGDVFGALAADLDAWTRGKTDVIKLSKLSRAAINLKLGSTLWLPLNSARTRLGPTGLGHPAGGIADALGLLMLAGGDTYAADRNPKLYDWFCVTNGVCGKAQPWLQQAWGGGTSSSSSASATSSGAFVPSGTIGIAVPSGGGYNLFDYPTTGNAGGQAVTPGAAPASFYKTVTSLHGLGLIHQRRQRALSGLAAAIPAASGSPAPAPPPGFQGMVFAGTSRTVPAGYVVVSPDGSRPAQRSKAAAVGLGLATLLVVAGLVEV